MTKGFRPPAVPLVTVDPYFNIWSMADRLYDNETKHWTGTECSMSGMILIDGKVYRYMGCADGKIPAIPQTEMELRPLNTVYTFCGEGIRLKVIFTTPLLPDDLDVLSRPASYVTFSVVSTDEKEHEVKIYFDASAQLCVNTCEQDVVWGRKSLGDGSTAMYMGTEEQPVLKKNGDNVRIDWGYAYLVVPGGTPGKTVMAARDIRRRFAEMKELDAADDSFMPRAANNDMPVMAACIDCGEVCGEEVFYFLVLAYDDIYSVEYFGKPLKGYWARNGLSFEEAVMAAVDDYGSLMKKARDFDERLLKEAEKCGGNKYADILALAYRQVIAAHKLVADEKGEVLFFSKECFSNGCMGTVDVNYQSAPLFLFYNTELVKGMLRPVFEFARMPVWTFDFAPHDVGCYPHANGQYYGIYLHNSKPGGKVFVPPLYTYPEQVNPYKPGSQMPVEECGNILIMTAAVCLSEKDGGFAEKNWDLLTKWVDYLMNFGMDPGYQMYTDDFTGRMAHNANLSIKAIMGIASYALLCKMLGKEEEGVSCMIKAKEMAAKWEHMADDGDHYRLAFDIPNSWGMKYNIIWDVIFGLRIFKPEIIEKEIMYYKKVANKYGVPLDNRSEFTHSFWLLWCATMAENPSDFKILANPLWDFVNETPDRVPFVDLYKTISGEQRLTHLGIPYQNRPVQGGLFIKLLKESFLSDMRSQ